MLVCFFNHKVTVHFEFIAQGEKVNQQCHLEVLTRLRESVQTKRPKLWPDKWILHHVNAPVHDALRVREFLAKKSITRNRPSTLFTWLSPLQFLAVSKIKKCPEGTKICRHSWHLTQYDITARYSGKRFSRLFPAVAPSSHEVHSFRRRVFLRRQQLLVHR